jgi:hypothetical protein
MNQELPDLAKFDRFLWEDADLLITAGEISPLIKGLEAYNARYQIKNPPAGAMPSVRRLLAAVSLAAAALPERESWGWSLTLPGSSIGFFVGAEPEGMICLRAEPAKRDLPLVVVQRQRAGGPLRQSSTQALDDDPVHAVSRYFDDAEQTRNRLAVDDDGKGVLIHALPDGRLDRVASMADAQLIERMDELAASGALKPVGEFLLFYECRCHEEMITDMVTNLPRDQANDIWEGQHSLEVACPRCGREYVVREKG